jgi:hypothetical protein
MITHPVWKLLTMVAVFVAAFCCDAVGYQNQYLTNVKVESAFVDLANNHSAAVSWRIQAGGKVDLMICHMDGFVVRHLLKQATKGIGTHMANWDGLDDEGRPVPNGAYFPMIRLNSRSKGMEFYNSTAVRWGGRLPVQDLEYDSDAQQITYRLGRAALCLVRVGEREGGPSYGTLLLWEPRSAGAHAEPWDGMDLQGVAKVHDREKFTIIFDTIDLPPNTFLVSGSSNTSYEAVPNQAYAAVHPPTGKDVYIHSLHARHICRDPEVVVELLSGVSGSKKGVDIFGGIVRVSVTTADAERAGILESMFSEVYLFVDGVFQGETKAPKLPGVVELSTKGLTPGRHTLTVNLRDFEDHVGALSLPFIKK